MKAFYVICLSALLLCLLVSCNKKRQVKVVVKTSSGAPIANVACGVSDDGQQVEIVVGHTNTDGIAILEFTRNKKSTVRVWSNSCDGSWKGQVQNIPIEVAFICP